MAPTQDALYARASTPTSPGRSATCPSGSGRSTSTGCTRTSASSSRSSSRRCSSATCRARRRVLDPFAGSGTTLVQSLESGRDATGVDVAAFNCLLMRGQDGEYNLFALEHELRDSLRRLEAFDASRPPRPSPFLAQWFAPQAAAELALLPLADRRLRARRRPARRARARGSLGAPDDALRPRLPAGAAARPVLVPQAQARPAARSSAPSTSSRRYALDTLARIKEFARVRARGREARVLHGDARSSTARRAVRRRRHLAAVPGPDRLPRAAPLRVRAARPRRPARPRARRRRGGDEPAAIAAYVDGIAACSRTRATRYGRGAPRPDRHQRPPRPLPGDPRARGPAARGSPAPARQPPHRPPRGRVLRGRAGRSRAS